MSAFTWFTCCQLQTVVVLIKITMQIYLFYHFQEFVEFWINLHMQIRCFITDQRFLKLCYVAVCNNYAICNTLQTALNCNAVCNTSYFKLRCEGNAICNVLQIALKFYHLKILKRRKKLINCKMHRFNNILLWIQLDTNLFAFGQNAILSPNFCEIWGGGGH